MKIQDAIRNRRSIRRYLDKVPGDKEIEKVLDSGIWAPSGLNNQPWKFRVVKGKEKDGLAGFTKYSRIIKAAPIAICVFLDKGAVYNRDKDIMAIGACIQNMLLASYELGLGSCWLGEILNRKEEVERYLNIDEDFELMAVVTLGYPDEGLTKSCRKKLKKFTV